MNKKLTTGIVLFAAASVAQGAFVISQPDNNANFGNLATGQTFTPSVGMEVDPGVNTETIDLVAFSLWSHGGSATGPSTGNLNTVYLLIYDAFPSVASFVGSSTNFVDHSPNLALGTQMTWTFNNLTLDYNTTYYAVFASSQTGVLGINDVGIGLQTQNTDPYAGGN
ncbi:MAG: hypothetical protein ACO3RV_08805, partial [Luteolibacter sp.]